MTKSYTTTAMMMGMMMYMCRMCMFSDASLSDKFSITEVTA